MQSHEPGWGEVGPDAPELPEGAQAWAVHATDPVRQAEFMLSATLKNKNWGKTDSTWPTKEQVKVQEGAQDRVQEDDPLFESMLASMHRCKHFMIQKALYRVWIKRLRFIRRQRCF